MTDQNEGVNSNSDLPPIGQPVNSPADEMAQTVGQRKFKNAILDFEQSSEEEEQRQREPERKLANFMNLTNGISKAASKEKASKTTGLDPGELNDNNVTVDPSGLEAFMTSKLSKQKPVSSDDNSDDDEEQDKVEAFADKPSKIGDMSAQKSSAFSK